MWHHAYSIPMGAYFLPNSLHSNSRKYIIPHVVIKCHAFTTCFKKRKMANLLQYGFTSSRSTQTATCSNETLQLELEVSAESIDTPPAKKKVKRSFQTKWCEQWPWLEHDEMNDTMFCRVCKQVRKGRRRR